MKKNIFRILFSYHRIYGSDHKKLDDVDIHILLMI